MKFYRVITLKDGRECILRSGERADGAALLEQFKLAHEETDFLLTYSYENSFTEESEVTFHKLTHEQIDTYVATGEAFDKAGGYAVQGEAGKFVKSVKGDIDTVIGLPVRRLLREFPELAELAAN